MVVLSSFKNFKVTKLPRVNFGLNPQPRDPPMTLGNMREQGVHRLIAFCLNDAGHHRALIDKRLNRLERRDG
jgi:hypothetical protein